MDANLRAKLKAWDREERIKATVAMVRATERGDVKKTKELLSRFPLLDHWIPYEAQCWSQLAAAAGQLKLMNFWRKREKTRPVSTQASLESLLFWAIGYEYIKPRGDQVRLAKYLLAHGADIEGDGKNYTPLLRAVARNRPKMVELLIQRGANLSRPFSDGQSALQSARCILTSQACARLLERAGAPLELPRRPERPKPVRTVDLRQSAQKISERIEKAVRSFARQHARETVSAIALASVPHEGYVMMSFETGKFEGSPWDCTYDEFAYVKFPDWTRAHDGDSMRLIDLDGRTQEKNPDAFESRFKKMIVTVLQSLEQKGTFDQLNTAKGCQVGIEMTLMGEARFWRLKSGKIPPRAAAR